MTHAFTSGSSVSLILQNCEIISHVLVPEPQQREPYHEPFAVNCIRGAQDLCVKLIYNLVHTMDTMRSAGLYTSPQHIPC